MFENTLIFFFIFKIDNASCQHLILDYRESLDFLIALGWVSTNLMLLYEITQCFIMNFREFIIKIALFFLNVHTSTRLNENKTKDGSYGLEDKWLDCQELPEVCDLEHLSPFTFISTA